MGRTNGKVVMVTGAARGQGRSHAIRLAEEGADLVLVDVCQQIEVVPYPLASPDDLEQTAADVRRVGSSALAHKVDIRDQVGLNRVVAEAIDQLGHIDALVANAGIIRYVSLLDATEEMWSTIIDVNLSGAWRAIKAVAPAMIAAGNGGSIVLTSSVAGLRGMPNLGAYVASKHGVNGLMKTACLELAPHQIRVNTINPGGVITPMIDNEMTRQAVRPDLERPTTSDMSEGAKHIHPIGIPWLEPIDISHAVVYLVSDESRYVTGGTFVLDGGITAG